MNLDDRGMTIKFVIRDRGVTFCGDHFDGIPSDAGVRIIRTPFRSPKSNSICERVIGTLRRECLERLLIINQGHLRAVLREYVGTTTSTGRIVLWTSTHPPAPSASSGARHRERDPSRSRAAPYSAASPTSTPTPPDHRHYSTIGLAKIGVLTMRASAR